MKREIQVFREAVGLEVALLEAGAALEDPGLRERWMRVDAGEYPAKDVVLLDNAGQESERRGGLEDFTLVDHPGAFFHRGGIQTRQAVTSRVQDNAGSSRV